MAKEKTLDLKSTIDDMMSDDYKQRFIAEYSQLRIRITKLDNFINRIIEQPETKHDCPILILKHQLMVMKVLVKKLIIKMFSLEYNQKKKNQSNI